MLLSYLLIALCTPIFLPLLIHCSLHIDQSAAEYLKNELLSTYPLPEGQILLIQKPFYPIDYSLLDTATWSKNGAKSTHPLISWSEILNRVPFLANKQQQLFFVDSTLTIDNYFSQLFLNYEWTDTSWNYGQCTFNCKLDLPNTILSMQSALEQLEFLYNQCNPNNLTCISNIQEPIAALQQQLETTQQIYIGQKQIMSDHSQYNINIKMMQYYQSISSSMLRNLNDFALSEFYPVSFSPSKFLEYLQFSTASLVQFSQQEVIESWNIQTISLPKLTSCQWNMRKSKNLLVELSKELKTSPSQLQSQNFRVISSSEHDWTNFMQRMMLRSKLVSQFSEEENQCKEISIHMVVAYVKVNREWLNLAIFDEPIGVNGIRTNEWSDGEFGGTFPAFLNGFFVAKQIQLIHFNGTEDVIELQIDNPTILAFTAQTVPSFPRQDSILFSNQTSLNSTDLMYSSTNISTSNETGWNADVFSMECCGRPTSYNCPVPRLKVQVESKIQVITLQQNLTQELKTLSSNMDDALRDVTTWTASLLTFTILVFIVSFLWPFVAIGLIMITWRNTLKQVKN